MNRILYNINCIILYNYNVFFMYKYIIFFLIYIKIIKKNINICTIRFFQWQYLSSFLFIYYYY